MKIPPTLYRVLRNLFAVIASLPGALVSEPLSKIQPCRPRTCCPPTLAKSDGAVVLAGNTTVPPSLQCAICGVTPARLCAACGSRTINLGAVAADPDARWLAFYCSGCGDAARPEWPPDRLRRLRRQWCLTCDRTAMYGPPGRRPRDAIYCQRHKVRDCPTDPANSHPRPLPYPPLRGGI